MKKLYYIRHGLSELNAQGLWAGTTDTPLVDEGRQQAREAGISAKGFGIRTIVSSPLSRAHETAQIIAAEIGVAAENIIVNDLFVERNFGTLEGTPYGEGFEIQEVHGIESKDAILGRARQAYAFLQTLQADTVLVVSHGSFGRALRHVINPEIPFDNDKKHKFTNATIVKLI